MTLPALFASCKDEIEEPVQASSSKGSAITFKPYQDGFQKPVTRALVDSVGDLNNVYVLSMRHDQTHMLNGDFHPDYWEQVFRDNALNKGINVLTLSNNGHTNDVGIWDYTGSSPLEDWEDGYFYKFRAYYPNTFNTAEGESCANGFEYNTVGGIPTGSTALMLNDYRSASDPRNNTDMLVSNEETRAYSDALWNDEAVELKMNHILSCVNFNIKKKEGTKLTITSFKIKDYVSKASYDGSDWKYAQQEYSGENVGNILNDFNFYNMDGTPLEVGNGDLHGNGNGNNKLKDKDFYVEYKGGSGENVTLSTYSAELSDVSKSTIPTTTTLLENYCTGLLMIPQTLSGKSEVIKIELPDNKNTVVKEAQINHDVQAEIKFYFDEASTTVLTARIDLTANGKIPAWEPGVKYTYTIGVFEYQVAVNIDVEAWQKHSYEEELK